MDKQTNLDKLLECPICRDVYTNPKALPCLHTFCLECIKACGQAKLDELSEELSLQDDYVEPLMPCPLCRQPFTIPRGGFAELPSNFLIKQLQEEQRSQNAGDPKHIYSNSYTCDLCTSVYDNEYREAMMYCEDCDQKICESCSKRHSKQKFAEKHRLITIKEMIEQVYSQKVLERKLPLSTDADEISSELPSTISARNSDQFHVYQELPIDEPKTKESRALQFLRKFGRIFAKKSDDYCDNHVPIIHCDSQVPKAQDCKTEDSELEDCFFSFSLSPRVYSSHSTPAPPPRDPPANQPQRTATNQSAAANNIRAPTSRDPPVNQSHLTSTNQSAAANNIRAPTSRDPLANQSQRTSTSQSAAANNIGANSVNISATESISTPNNNATNRTPFFRRTSQNINASSSQFVSQSEVVQSRGVRALILQLENRIKEPTSSNFQRTSSANTDSPQIYVAMYDFEAQCPDDVSFKENDRIHNFEECGEGWGVGTVVRTGQTGEIPSNYIRLV
jgi:hypothetical protein